MKASTGQIAEQPDQGSRRARKFTISELAVPGDSSGDDIERLHEQSGFFEKRGPRRFEYIEESPPGCVPSSSIDDQYRTTKETKWTDPDLEALLTLLLLRRSTSEFGADDAEFEEAVRDLTQSLPRLRAVSETGSTNPCAPPSSFSLQQEKRKDRNGLPDGRSASSVKFDSSLSDNHTSRSVDDPSFVPISSNCATPVPGSSPSSPAPSTSRLLAVPRYSSPAPAFGDREQEVGRSPRVRHDSVSSDDAGADTVHEKHPSYSNRWITASRSAGRSRSSSASSPVPFSTQKPESSHPPPAKVMRSAAPSVQETDSPYPSSGESESRDSSPVRSRSRQGATRSSASSPLYLPARDGKDIERSLSSIQSDIATLDKSTRIQIMDALYRMSEDMAKRGSTYPQPSSVDRGVMRLLYGVAPKRPQRASSEGHARPASPAKSASSSVSQPISIPRPESASTSVHARLLNSVPPSPPMMNLGNAYLTRSHSHPTLLPKEGVSVRYADRITAKIQDSDSKPQKRRVFFTEDQKEKLNSYYNCRNGVKHSPSEIASIAQDVGITDHQVRIYFQNKRARNREKQNGSRSLLDPSQSGAMHGAGKAYATRPAFRENPMDRFHPEMDTHSQEHDSVFYSSDDTPKASSRLWE